MIAGKIDGTRQTRRRGTGRLLSIYNVWLAQQILNRFQAAFVPSSWIEELGVLEIKRRWRRRIDRKNGLTNCGANRKDVHIHAAAESQGKVAAIQ
jgi:hypothetical protein